MKRLSVVKDWEAKTHGTVTHKYGVVTYGCNIR